MLNKQRNLFKLFQNDVGLLAYQYSNGIQMEILKGNVTVNFGSVYENLVAQELISKGYPTFYFNSKKLGELDFVMDMQNYNIKRAVVLCNENLTEDGRLLNLPIYMIMFFKKSEPGRGYFSLFTR